MKPYEKLLRYWRDAGVQMNIVQSPPEYIDRLEKQYGIRLPSDFRDYLLYCTPQDERSSQADFDNTYTTWWHLDRIKNIPDEYQGGITDPVIARDAAKYIFFADYIAWCWAWAIACTQDENFGRIVVIDGRDRFVADSFGEFVDIYLDDIEQIN